MDARNSIHQAVARGLVTVLLLNPLLGAAAELAVDRGAGGNANLGQAANGVPIVNIATPNGKGLSHNKFSEYNVGSEGLILNNATGKIQSTQLGGIILGNSNLKGQAAALILNEVTGSSQSQLKGYTEVAGKGAHVVLANPHGITCDGCGFLNTPRATLSTGKPIIVNGHLQSFDVDGGEIHIEGAGINAGNVSQFDLITRSAQINAELHANQLNVITGRNEVDAASLNAIAKTDDRSAKPLLAIDSSALGGMYAGAIRLVGTEAGVGVNLAGDMAASAGDIRMDANGQLSLARSAARDDLHLSAESIELNGDTYAGGQARLSARADIDVAGQQRLAAAGDIRLTAQVLENRGDIESGRNDQGQLNPARALRIETEELYNQGQLTAHGALEVRSNSMDNQSGILLGSQVVELEVAELDNRHGQIISQQGLSLNGSQLDNRNGTLASNQALAINLTGQLDISDAGLVFSQSGGLKLVTDEVKNVGGTVQTEQGALQISAQRLNNRAGRIATRDGALQLQVAGIDNQQGSLLASGGVLASNGQRLNNQQGRLQGESLQIISSASLSNDDGKLIATGGDTRLQSGHVSNTDGEMLAHGDLLLSGTSLNNDSGVLGAQVIDLTLSDALNNIGGLVEAAERLQLHAAELDNQHGELRALGDRGTSRIQLQRHFSNGDGLVEIGNASFSLSSASLNNSYGSILHLGEQGFALNVADMNDAGGRIISNSDLTVSLASWFNTSLLQARNLTLNIEQLTQGYDGQLIAIQRFTGSGEAWSNDGLLASDDDFSLNLTGGYRGYGDVTSLGDMQLSAASLQIGEGVDLRSGGRARLDISGTLYNEGGQLTAVDGLRVNAAELDNQGALGSAARLQINAPSLLNQGLLFSGADMALFSDHLSNRYGDIYSLGSLLVSKNAQGEQADLLENRSGSIESLGSMDLRAALLENRKQLFELGREQTYGHISVKCYDCGGDHHNVDYIATERFNTVLSSDSAAARIHSGGDLAIQGGAVSNLFSSLSASGDIALRSDTLLNLGAESGAISRVQRFNTGRVTDGTDERFRDNYINPYNAQALPKVLPSALSRWSQLSDIETFTPDGMLAPAVIQAGGLVSIQADQGLSNGTLSAFNTPLAGAGQQLDTLVSSNQQTLQVRLNPQLPPDISQQVVNPLSLPGFSLPSGHGLFQLSMNPAHPYLIETKPAFASLKNFLNSGYLLSRLGYSADQMQRRLGDGLYEQHLIQQAITARTGQRFIAGLDSDEAMFRYLMDNAIASKEALQLSVGVALTAEQVAALTHDILWLQVQEVNGQRVLVPVLYLAQANDRLAPTGALIQGRDVALISGAALNNSGTLRATQNLSATASRIDNSGLLQANQRLSLLATDSIRNAQGGIITGQEVSAIALTGDIRNERTITQQGLGGKGYSQLTSVVDNAARIEATGDLTLAAGGDLQNIGGALSAGGNASLSAARNVVIAAASEEQAQMRKDKRHHWENSNTTQHASEVQIGSDLRINAGNNLEVVASTLKAAGDISLEAGIDLTMASAANQSNSAYHYKRSDKHIDMQDSTVRQQATMIEAGGDLVIAADRDLNLQASQFSAGDEAYLYAGNQLSLLAAQNIDYHLYNYEKDGGTWGSSKTQRDEISTVSNAGSTIKTGGDLTLISEGDQIYQRALLESGNDLTIDSGGAISFEGVKDLKQESHEKSSSNLAWTSSKGKGQTDETLLQSQLIAQGQIAIQAVDGLNIEIKQINKQSVSQTIDTMVKADPQLAWLKDAEQRGDVDWQRVEEIHDSFKYSNSGLGQGAAIALAIAIAATTAGAASGLAGTAAGATAGSGTSMAAGLTVTTTSAAGVATTTTVAAGWGNVMAATALSSMAGTAAVSAINNRGDLGAVTDDTFSSDNIKGYATGAFIAGLGSYTSGWGRELTPEGNWNPETVVLSERLKAYSANTALKGLLSGDDDKNSWLTIAGTGAMTELYQYWVGRDPDVRPGVERPDGPKFTPLPDGLVPQVEVDGQLRDGMNIGHNRLGCAFYEICHGTPISQGLNIVPGFNAFATLHDTWMNKMVDPNLFQNIGTMPPALLVNYGALYDKYRVIGEQAKKINSN
jgi:filamentous hemagglutinin